MKFIGNVLYFNEKDAMNHENLLLLRFEDNIDKIFRYFNLNRKFFVRSEKIEHIDSYSFDGKAILIPGDGRIGEIYHYINGKFDYHQRVYKISNFKNVNGKYVYYYFEENFLKEAKRNTAKATVDSLRLSTITDMKIKILPINIQNRIVDLLSLIDSNSSLLEREIELNKEFKHSLLSKMFC